MGHIPGVKQPRLYERKWIAELVSVGPPILAAGIGAITNLNDLDPFKQYMGRWLLAGCAWLVISSVLKVRNAYVQDREEQRKQNYDGLLGALLVLYRTLVEHLGIPDDDGTLRMTIHRVVEAPKPNQAAEQLEQVLPYIGGQGKGAGRRFSIRSGIIGRAVRDAAPYTFVRQTDDYDAFINEMVSEWGYTRDEARALTEDRQAWMAVPIQGPQGALGVVYLDTNSRDLFAPEVQVLVINGCRGIADYVDARYSER